MKISKVNVSDVANYIRVDSEEETKLLNSILVASKSYIKNYTGLDEKAMDEYEDLSIALLVLCSEMYDNRQFTVEKSNINPVISSILDMHSINLL